MRKLAIALVAFLALLVGICGPGAAAKPPAAKLTIHSLSEGVFGLLSGAPKDCLANRQVIVFEQEGATRDPSKDRKVGSTRARLDGHSYRWEVKTGDRGHYYARTAAKKGCGTASSVTVEPSGVDVANGDGDIPICSPYTAEGPGEVCALQPSGAAWGLYYDFPARGSYACEIQKSDYSCEGDVGGPAFPFGNSVFGGRNPATMSWRPGPNGFKSVTITSGGGRGYGSSRIEARLPGPGSAELYVDKATTITDTGATVEFFTPNLPGQAAGEPGGPLYLNFEGGKGFAGLGAAAQIKGYLYVKYQLPR